MPCATIHLALAGRSLREWQAAPSTAPFPLRSETVEAFLHGVMAPDVGFVPGSERFPSVLAHYVRPADLVRGLAEGARTDAQWAFITGWIAHLLGDEVLHPRVGHACGEAARGDVSIRMNALEDLETHVGIEVGLDIITLRGDPTIPRPVPRPFFTRHTITWLCDGYTRAYGLAPDPVLALKSHARASARTARWPLLLRVIDRAHGLAAPRRSGPRLVVDLARRASRPGTAVRGLLSPLHPPAWLVEESRGEADRFPTRLKDVLEAGLEALENRNLESGAPSGPDDPHPEAQAAYRRLTQMARGTLRPGAVPSG